jgi:hypothetical protein
MLPAQVHAAQLLCHKKCDRQSQTMEEKEAFQRFAGELLECVVGKIAKGRERSID